VQRICREGDEAAIAGRRAALRSLGVVALVWLCNGCSRSDATKLLDLVPTGGRPLQDRGAFEVPLNRCEVEVARLLGAGAGKHPQVRRYRVPENTTWSAVTEFYAANLDKSWRPGDFPERSADYTLRVWLRDGLGGSQRFAVALLDQAAVGSDDHQPFRILVAAVEED